MPLLFVILGLSGLGCEPIHREPAEAFKVADAVVVVNYSTAKSKSGARWYEDAVADLSNILSRVTGVRTMVYEEGKEPTCARAIIYFGETRAAKRAGVQDVNLRRADWRVKTVPGRAYLYAESGAGASYAMTEFVETFLGYRFLTLDGMDPFVPSPDVRIPLADIIRKPVLYDRNIYTAMLDGRKYPTTKGALEAWMRRRRMFLMSDEMEGRCRISKSAGGCHSIHNYIPPEEYFSVHPEYFSAGYDGKRKGVRNAQSQICYSNPKVREIVYENLLKFIERDRKQAPTNYPCIYDMTQMDNSSFLCLCPECKKIIAKYNRKDGGHREGGDAGLQLEFVNEIARRVRVKYPDVLLRIFAYVSSECAPKPGTIIPEPNVVIWWCDVYSHSDHTLPLATDGHFNAKQAFELGEWMKITKNIQLWDYMLYGNSFPEVSADAIAADAAFFAENGVSSIMMETEYQGQCFYELNAYLMSELYVDPAKDVEGLIHAFCRVYGKGAAEMERAISFLRMIERTKCAGAPDSWHSRMLPWLNRADMEKFASLVKMAYDKEPDARIRSRIANVLLTTYRQLVSILRKDPNSKDALEDAKSKFVAYSREMAVNGFMEQKDRNSAIAKAEEEMEVLSLKFDDLPAQLQNVAADDLVCIDYHAVPEHNRRADSKSSRGWAMAGTGAGFKGSYPIPCGIYDRQSKESFRMSAITSENVPPDGRYHWFKAGSFRNGRDTILWYPGDWSVNVGFRDYAIVSDGAVVDPNWYDLWFSVRVEGKGFDQRSDGQDMVRIDRIVLRRISPPAR